MYKLFVIAKNNMKKQKGDMITFLILTFLAALLIFDCASAIVGMNHVLDETFNRVNGAHVILYCGDSEDEINVAKKAFTENKNILSYEMTPCINMTVKYRKKGDKDYMEYMFIAESFEENKSIMNLNKPVKSLGQSEILLPYNMHNSFAIGDILQLKLDDEVYDLKVAGYLEDPLFCSTLNISIYGCYLSQEMFDEFIADHPSVAQSFIACKGRVSEKEIEDGTLSTIDIESEIGDVYKAGITRALEEHPDRSYAPYMLQNWQVMRGGGEFLPITAISIILVFAVLILIIAIVIISFSVNNFIQKNMKNTGILEASGYTVNELRWALTLQIVLVGLVGSLIGITVGIMTFDIFGSIVSSVLGLVWNQPVNASIAVITVIGIVITLGVVARVISRTYNKISVLDALRGGISTHNFKRNYFSFENTPLPIPVTMALKETFGGKGRNIQMAAISMLLTISTLIGFGLFETFGKDNKGIYDILGFEAATVFVSDNDPKEDYEELSEKLKSINGVDNVLTQVGFEPVIKYGDKKQTIYTYACDDLDNSRNTIITEGRGQEEENEIMVTPGVAKDLGVKVGDVVTIQFADKEADYLIVGMNQKLERMGRTIYMTIDGAKKVMPGKLQYEYYVNGKEGVTYDEIVKEISKLEKADGFDFSYIDLEKNIEGTTESLKTALNIICLIIVIVTILVVIFVESLVIRAKISREWRGMGISKALGQTSSNLISQIMLSNMPAVLTGAIIGALLSPVAGRNVCKAVFSLFVMKNIPFNILPHYLIIVVAGIVVIAILTSALAGLKVRSLKPVEMITEE